MRLLRQYLTLAARKMEVPLMWDVEGAGSQRKANLMQMLHLRRCSLSEVRHKQRGGDPRIGCGGLHCEGWRRTRGVPGK
jgi:hypothetical protein